jgi:Tol biopolymer transport system component
VTTGLDAQTITLSPDGTRLAYARLRSSTNIWSIPMPRAGMVSAAGARPVTSGDQTIEQVDVSADGRWLVFDSDRGGNADIYRQPASGGEATQLTTDSAGDFSPVWSPDGGRIAFHSRRNDNRDLFTMNADGTGLEQRTSSPRHELDPGWAPDGRAIVAQVIDTGGPAGWSFVIVPVDGAAGGARELPAEGDFAEWSPTGDLIAYHTADGIRVISPDGGPTRLLASNAADGTEAFYAAWSPDGNALYYLARGDAGWMIRAVPRGGGASRVLVRFDDPARQPAAYGFATDGRTFYFTVGSHESDVWAMELGPP